MTEELRAKIDKYVRDTCVYYRSTHEDMLPNQFEKYLRSACIHFATENSIQWHDLRKDPNDLPKDTYDVLDQAGYKVHYNFFQDVWVNEENKIDRQVIAWCEIPQFKEKV